MKRPGRKYVVRGAALALALLLTALDFTGALAVTQADINALQSDADELDAKRKELESQLDSLSDDKAQALKRKELLDQMCIRDRPGSGKARFHSSPHQVQGPGLRSDQG